MLPLLVSADLTALGFLAGASNHTLLVRVGVPETGLHAVYKPRRGERPLWDFPTGTLYLREVAAYVVSDFLGWGLVPPTVVREGPFGIGSVQLFVPHDPERHYFVLVEDEDYARPLARLAYFDLLVNNADRKGSHILVPDPSDPVRVADPSGPEDHGPDAADGAAGTPSPALIAIDHGVTFNTHPKLRTVVWDLGPARIDADWRRDAGRLADALGDREAQITRRLQELLTHDEVEALRARAHALRHLDCLPEVPDNRRPYPWPPL